MPLYDYKCTECDHAFERNSKIADRKIPCEDPCTECGGEIVQVIHAPKIISGRSGGLKQPNWFQDKVKDMKKMVGKDNTLGNIL